MRTLRLIHWIASAPFRFEFILPRRLLALDERPQVRSFREVERRLFVQRLW